MNTDRKSKEYVDGMCSFLEVAKANKNPVQKRKDYAN
jgi:hypothetical protein